MNCIMGMCGKLAVILSLKNADKNLVKSVEKKKKFESLHKILKTSVLFLSQQESLKVFIGELAQVQAPLPISAKDTSKYVIKIFKCYPYHGIFYTKIAGAVQAHPYVFWVLDQNKLPSALKKRKLMSIFFGF